MRFDNIVDIIKAVTLAMKFDPTPLQLQRQYNHAFVMNGIILESHKVRPSLDVTISPSQSARCDNITQNQVIKN